MSAYDWFLAAWLTLGIFITITQVGKPRKPIEPLAAGISTLITLGLIAGLLISRGAIA